MHSKSNSKLVLVAIFLTLTVIVLGAYTRLIDAGLGCPDWPGWYGRLIASSLIDDLPNPTLDKAWIEMVHRYVAGSLGLLIAVIFFQAILKHKPKQGFLITAS